MKKFFIPLLIVVVIGFSGLGIARLLFGGGEDTWICANEQWIKHGNPNSPMPQSGCGEMQSDWQSQTVNEIGVTFKHPKKTTFRKEIAEDAAGIHSAGFFVEKEGYTLYGIYQPNKEATEIDITKAKTEMDTTTIKDVTIAGYKGIEGLIMGPKTRYITILLKNNRLFTVSTIPPTQQNKALTDEILATFIFQ